MSSILELMFTHLFLSLLGQIVASLYASQHQCLSRQAYQQVELHFLVPRVEPHQQGLPYLFYHTEARLTHQKVVIKVHQLLMTATFKAALDQISLNQNPHLHQVYLQDHHLPYPVHRSNSHLHLGTHLVLEGLHFIRQSKGFWLLLVLFNQEHHGLEGLLHH